MAILVAGCGVEDTGEVAAAGVEELEVIDITAADADVVLELSDAVVYTIEAGVVLHRVVLVTEDGELDLASLVGDNVGASDAMVFGNQVAMNRYYGTEGAGMLRMPGCWWEFIQGTGWVRYCIA